MKIIFTGLLLLGSVAATFACNTCGCAASNQQLGILPQLSGSFIGLQYQYRWYESRHDATEANKAPGNEYYHSVVLWGRYSLGKRIQVYAFLPYQYNSKNEGGSLYTLSGIGDASVLANVQLLRPKSTCEKWQHYLQAGGGLKAPTGAYNNMVLGSGDDLAPNMQAGTGSWDFVTDANYTLQHGHAGLNAEATYVITTPNHQDYKYGNRVSAGLKAFYQLQRGKLRVLPAIGARYDYSMQDYDNYTASSLAQYTGGYMLYASAGVQAYYRHFGVDLSYSQPAAQHYGGGLVTSKGKMSGGVVYLF